ncbi:MAG: hypothetical protein R2753_15670 [Chitinophagales bacterium]
MLRSLHLLFLILICTSILEAQPTSSYNWNAPKYDITPDDTTLQGLILLDYRAIDFKRVKAPFVSISNKTRLVHRRIYLNNDSIIDQYSQLKIPVEEVSDILKLQVRVLSKNKKTELTFEALKDSIRLEDDLMVLSLQGIETGNILEYLYEIEITPNAFGSELFQFDLPTKYAELQLIGNGLAFELKGYNGVNIKINEEGGKRNAYGSILKNIPAFKDEFYAANTANKMRIDYAVKGMDWNMLSQVITLNVIYNKKKIKKKFEAILNNELKLFKYASKAEKIIAIEEYIKTNYEVIDEEDEALSSLNEILASKKANENGIVYLFAAFLNAAEIPYEVAATSDRFARAFDRDFASPLNLGYFLFYFSDEKKFLTPFPYRYRYGIVPDYLLGQEALSVSGSFSKGKGVISNHRFVTMANAIEYKDEITEDITVEFPPEGEIFISKMIDLNGYRALEFINDYHKSEDKKDFVTEFLAIENVEIANKLMINGSAELPEKLNGENVIIYVELLPDAFIGKSGDGMFVFHLGKLIGDQMKLDETEARSQAIELNYPINYNRSIHILKDANCTLIDLDTFNIDLDIPENLKDKMNFSSSVNSSANKIVITIQEYYSFLQLDQQDYSTFKQVINAASAFNLKNVIVSWE